MSRVPRETRRRYYEAVVYGQLPAAKSDDRSLT